MPTPFVNEKFTFTNPDGTTVEVIGTGNQFFAHFETVDGYTVIKDPESGFYTYATTSEDNGFLAPIDNAIVGQTDPKKLDLEKHVRVSSAVANKMANASDLNQEIEPRWKLFGLMYTY